MKTKILCLDFNFNNPYMNLAYEECLLEYVKNADCHAGTKAVVATWQNENSVVIGRNQSAAEECNLAETNRDNVIIARRITGGGAVYHDLGNLNFSFMLPRRYHNINNSSRIITEALKNLGISAVLSGRNDILIDGYKFSGNAYYSNDFVGLHHGTILISTDLDKIKRYLTPNKARYRNNTTTSVAARVSNISALYPAVTLEKVKKSIQDAFVVFAASLGLEPTEISKKFIPDNAIIEEKYNKYKSHEWIWKTLIDPPFCEGCFEWGRIVMFFHVYDGIIKACDIVTDSMHLNVWNLIKDAVRQMKLDRSLLLEKFTELEHSCTNREYKQILHDIRSIVEKIEI